MHNCGRRQNSQCWNSKLLRLDAFWIWVIIWPLRLRV
ncbi:rCG59536 [Rattus norvegicus]|uniref:RCG59536 n=1 Tax=Rattus norvegicus TaxID=10116 RepID=A6HQN5_RAT|nr:rCG59536 [Rattus norvegicus]